MPEFNINISRLKRNMAQDVTSNTVILEYIQNAADCGAESFEIVTTAASLPFRHDGTPFSLEDIQAFQQFFGSTKSLNGNTIGGFGRGARSALFYCKELQIRSSNHLLKIDTDSYPEVGSTIHKTTKNFGDKTEFILLHMSNKELSVQDLRTSMNEFKWNSTIADVHHNMIAALANFACTDTSLRRISVTSAQGSTTYSAKLESEKKTIVSVESTHLEDTNHCFHYRIKKSKSGKIAVGYFDDLDEQLQMGCFCNGLPMPIETGTGLFINAKFHTNQSRDVIDVSSREKMGAKNAELIREAALLLNDWILADRSEWIGSRRLARVLPSRKTIGAGKSPSRSFISAVRSLLRSSPILPSNNISQEDSLWVSPSSIGKSAAYNPPLDFRNWPVSIVVSEKTNSIQELCSLLGIPATTGISTIKILGDNAIFREDTFSGFNRWIELQADIAEIIGSLKKKELVSFFDRYVSNLPILLHSQSVVCLTPRECASRLTSNLMEESVKVSKRNNRQFIELSGLFDLSKIFFEALEAEEQWDSAFNSLIDSTVLSRLTKKDCKNLIKLKVWRNVQREKRSLEQLIDGTDLPTNISNELDIRSACLHETCLVAAHKIAEKAGGEVPRIIPLNILSSAVRRLRNQLRATTESEIVPKLLCFANYLLSNFGSAVPNNESKYFPNPTLRSKWIPICKPGSVTLARISDFAFPNELATGHGVDVVELPPFGDSLDWRSRSGEDFANSFQMINLGRFEDTLNLLKNDPPSYAKTRNILKIRKLLHHLYADSMNALDNRVLSNLPVHTEYSIEPKLGVSLPPVRQMAKVLQFNEIYSYPGLYISGECWNYLCLREKELSVENLQLAMNSENISIMYDPVLQILIRQEFKPNAYEKKEQSDLQPLEVVAEKGVIEYSDSSNFASKEPSLMDNGDESAVAHSKHSEVTEQAEKDVLESPNSLNVPSSERSVRVNGDETVEAHHKQNEVKGELGAARAGSTMKAVSTPEIGEPPTSDLIPPVSDIAAKPQVDTLRGLGKFIAASICIIAVYYLVSSSWVAQDVGVVLAAFIILTMVFDRAAQYFKGDPARSLPNNQEYSRLPIGWPVFLLLSLAVSSVSITFSLSQAPQLLKLVIGWVSVGSVALGGIMVLLQVRRMSKSGLISQLPNQSEIQTEIQNSSLEVVIFLAVLSSLTVLLPPPFQDISPILHWIFSVLKRIEFLLGIAVIFSAVGIASRLSCKAGSKFSYLNSKLTIQLIYLVTVSSVAILISRFLAEPSERNRSSWSSSDYKSLVGLGDETRLPLQEFFYILLAAIICLVAFRLFSRKSRFLAMHVRAVASEKVLQFSETLAKSGEGSSDFQGLEKSDSRLQVANQLGLDPTAVGFYLQSAVDQYSVLQLKTLYLDEMERMRRDGEQISQSLHAIERIIRTTID